MLLCHHLKAPLFLATFILISTLGLLSCNDNAAIDSKAVAQELNKPNADLTKESDERFLVSAAEINYRQILTGKLARQRATDPSVKELAAEVEEAHREAKSSLASRAIMEGIAVPSSPTPSAMACYDKLNEKAVESFDQEYCAMVIQDHKDIIALFEKVTVGKHDPDVQSLASSLLPVMRVYLARAQACETQLNPVSDLIR